VTGTVALIFSAVGILSSGAVISKYKPKARKLALWNVIVGGLTVVGMIVYAFLGCAENEKAVVFNTPQSLVTFSRH
jgi:solute carrier organic anion transporter family, member 5A